MISYLLFIEAFVLILDSPGIHFDHFCNIIDFINSFASHDLGFEEKSESFLVEKASNLTHEFLYDNFNKKMLTICFLFKFSNKYSCVKFDAFSKGNSSFFPLKTRR